MVLIAASGHVEASNANIWSPDKPRLSIQCGNWVDSVAFSPNGRLMAIAGFNNPITIWSTRTWTRVRTLGPQGDASVVTFSPDGRALAAALYDGRLIEWSSVSWKPIWTVTFASFASLSRLIYSSSGRLLITGGMPLQVISSTDGHEVQRIDAVIDSAVALSPDNTLLAVPQAYRFEKPLAVPRDPLKRTMPIVDVRTGHVILRLPVDMVQIATAFSPDGRQVAVAGRGGVIAIWNPVTGTLIKRITNVPMKVDYLVYKPTGHVLLALSQDGSVNLRSIDGTVRMWDSRTGRLLRVIHANDMRVSSIAVSNDGNLLATGSIDGSVKIWSIR